MKPSILIVLLTVLASPGCGDEEIAAADHGRALFGDARLSTSPFNKFACSTCHVVEPSAPAIITGRFDPGSNLGNVVGRPHFWGAQESSLLAAINVCLVQFMGGRALTADQQDARALYEYLDRESPAVASEAAPFNLVRNVTDLAGMTGDAARGQALYTVACFRCHGGMGVDGSRLDRRATVVPNDTVTMHGEFARGVIVEKLRHGKFFNIGGVMPLYSSDVLSDQQVADLLTYMKL